MAQGDGVFIVTRAVGHANPNMTHRYDRRSDDAIRNAVALLEVPRVENADPTPSDEG